MNSSSSYQIPSPQKVEDQLRKREMFAVSLRKQKKESIIIAKRQKLLSKVKKPQGQLSTSAGASLLSSNPGASKDS